MRGLYLEYSFSGSRKSYGLNRQVFLGKLTLPLMGETSMEANSHKSKERGSNNLQVGFYFDQTRCDGCYACVVACKDWHDIAAGPASLLRIFTIEKGKYPDPFLAFNFNPCYHCIDAPCVLACPVEAIDKREKDGIVLIDREKCLGRDECGYSCSHECPVGNDVLGVISLIKDRKYYDAWRLLADSNPFSGVCGRICFHPCETACNRNQVDDSVNIQAIERFVADFMPTVPPFTVEHKKQRVAIVGSGPAGLSCAYHLARFGYRVTVFEALPVIGGMLRVAIPEYRLPRVILDREIAFIKALGVEVRTNTCVGRDISIEELDKFDAVFVAIGTHRDKLLNIGGVELQGVITGLGFLKEVNINGKLNIAKKVVVLGGGNVAYDCARTALRLGATEVHIVCPEECENMLAEPLEIKQGEEEGIKIHASTIARNIMGLNNQVTGVECIRLRSMAWDQYGELHFDAIKGSETILPADTVIVAIGQEPDVSFLPNDIKVSCGVINIDKDGATTRAKYFAGGDAAVTERKVAWAIGSGRRAAQTIDRQLRGLSGEKESPLMRKSELRDTDFIKHINRTKNPMIPISRRIGNFAEVVLGLDEEQAKEEANRCLICRGMCSVACPYGAAQFGAENNPKMQKCDYCVEELDQGKLPICVRSCTTRALDAGFIDEMIFKYGDDKKAEGFDYYEKSQPSITFRPKAYNKRSQTGGK